MRATDRLIYEHELIERVLDLMDTVVSRIRAGERLPSGLAAWTIEFIRDFADGQHHGKEEEVLFPLLEQRGVPRVGGPVGVMLSEHDLGRDFVGRMQQALDQIPVDALGFCDAAQAYCTLLRQHIFKENNVLFRIAAQACTPQDDKRMLAAFEKLEHECNQQQLHDRYADDLRRWRDQLGLSTHHECHSYGTPSAACCSQCGAA